jgi:NAD(P)H-dependent flavin oxidoreductase YrpB (nitropropane dioxygenase family)
MKIFSAVAIASTAVEVNIRELTKTVIIKRNSQQTTTSMSGSGFRMQTVSPPAATSKAAESNCRDLLKSDEIEAKPVNIS